MSAAPLRRLPSSSRAAGLVAYSSTISWKGSGGKPRRGKATASGVRTPRRSHQGQHVLDGTTGWLVSTMKSVGVVTRPRTSCQLMKTSDPAERWWMPAGVRVMVPSPARSVARHHPT